MLCCQLGNKSCNYETVSKLLEQPCNKLNISIKLITSYHQVFQNLLAISYGQYEHNLLAAGRHTSQEVVRIFACNVLTCLFYILVNGGYSAFGSFTECSVTCGQGVKYRRRTCTQPKPQYNGESCRKLGPSIESRTCNAGPCPQKHVHKEKTIKKITKKVKGM